MDSREIGSELLERWALHYLGRYASSTENLRRVLMAGFAGILPRPRNRRQR